MPQQPSPSQDNDLLKVGQVNDDDSLLEVGRVNSAPAPKSKPRKSNLDALTSFANEHSLKVGSTTGGKHNRGSKHYSGNAIDVDHTGVDYDTISRAAAAKGFRVRDERVRPKGQMIWGGPHYHVEYDDGVDLTVGQVDHQPSGEYRPQPDASVGFNGRLAATQPPTATSHVEAIAANAPKPVVLRPRGGRVVTETSPSTVPLKLGMKPSDISAAERVKNITAQAAAQTKPKFRRISEAEMDRNTAADQRADEIARGQHDMQRAPFGVGLIAQQGARVIGKGVRAAAGVAELANRFGHLTPMAPVIAGARAAIGPETIKEADHYLKNKAEIHEAIGNHAPIDESLPKAAARAFTNAGYDLGTLVLITSTTGISFPAVMLAEAAANNSDKSPEEIAQASATAYAMGKAYEYLPGAIAKKLNVTSQVGTRALGAGGFGTVGALQTAYAGGDSKAVVAKGIAEAALGTLGGPSKKATEKAPEHFGVVPKEQVTQITHDYINRIEADGVITRQQAEHMRDNIAVSRQPAERANFKPQSEASYQAETQQGRARELTPQVLRAEDTAMREAERAGQPQRDAAHTQKYEKLISEGNVPEAEAQILREALLAQENKRTPDEQRLEDFWADTRRRQQNLEDNPNPDWTVKAKDGEIELHNEAAIQLLTRFYQRQGAASLEAQVRGSSEQRPDLLADMAKKGDSNEQAFAAALRKASNGIGDPIIIYSSPENRRHEVFHRSSGRGSNYARLQDRHDPEGFDRITSLEYWPSIEKALNENGYTHGREQHVEEMAAHLSEGRHEQLGLNLDQSVEAMTTWLSSYAKKNGHKSLEHFKNEIGEPYEQARRDVYDIHEAGAAATLREISPSVQDIPGRGRGRGRTGNAPLRRRNESPRDAAERLSRKAAEKASPEVKQRLVDWLKKRKTDLAKGPEGSKQWEIDDMPPAYPNEHTPKHLKELIARERERELQEVLAEAGYKDQLKGFVRREKSSLTKKGGPLFAQEPAPSEKILSEALRDGSITKDQHDTTLEKLRSTSIKNKVTTAERAERSQDPIEVEARRTFGDVFEAGKKSVDNGDINIRALAESWAKKARALSPEESTALLYDRMRLQNEFRVNNEKLEQAHIAGNKEAIHELEMQQAAIETARETNDTASRRTGYEQGLGLAIRKALIREDYSLLNVLQRAKNATGNGKVAPKVRAKVEKLVNELDAAQAKIEAHKKRLEKLITKREGRLEVIEGLKKKQTLDVFKESESNKEIAEFLKPKKREKRKLDEDGEKLQDHADRLRAQIDAEIRTLRPGRAWRDISTMRKAYMLMGPKTSLRNVAGNTANAVFNEAARIPSSILDACISVVTGKRAMTASLTDSLRSIAHAAKVGGKEAVHTLRHGASQEQLREMQFPNEINSGSKLIDYPTKFVFRFMSAQDRVFYQAGFKRNLLDRARVQAINEARANGSGKGINERIAELVENPTVELKEAARHDALILTFNNSNKLSDGITRGRSALSPAQNFALDIILPFDRTPTNIVMRVIEGSPLGFAKNAKQIAKAITNKGMTLEEQRQFSKTFGIATTGSLMMFLGWKLGAAGLLTSADDEKHQMSINTGMKSLPNDGFIEVGRLSPVGNLMVLGASLQKESLKKEGSYAKQVGSIPLEQPLLRSTTDLGEVIRNPRRGAGKFIGNQAFTFVPGSGLVREIARQTDSEDRKVSNEFSLKGVSEQIQKNVPILRKRLPLKRKR